MPRYCGEIKGTGGTAGGGTVSTGRENPDGGVIVGGFFGRDAAHLP